MKLKQDISGLTMMPAGGGVFEVTVNGQNIYSKKQTGEFPEPELILQKVRSLR